MKIVKDYFLDHYSYISEERMDRPDYLRVEEEKDTSGEDCPFCAGHEDNTPPEILRRDDGNGSWKMRVIPNKFPAVLPDDPAAHGYQEILIETPDHYRHLWDFSSEEAADLFILLQERLRELQNDSRIQYVVIFKNHGKASGSSLSHAHTQLIATSVFPSRVERKLHAINQLGYCPYCAIGEEEKGRERVIFENHDFLVFAPRAPRFIMETWIMAKEHGGDFASFSQEKLGNMASALLAPLSHLKRINAPYCFYLYYGVGERELHFHIELLPRLQKWGGFELATGDYIIGVPPEKAAQLYREGR